MAVPVETILPYIPGLVLRRLAGDSYRPGHSARRLRAAVLYTDISGFTPLAEAFARQGPAGAEELSGVLNSFYDPLISRIADHGGDVAKLAGDALVAIWAVEDESDPADALLSAAHCALDVQRTAGRIVLQAGLRLLLKAGVGVGEIAAMHVGGVRDRWELLLAGEPLTQMSLAEHRAGPGEVIVSPEATRFGGPAFLGDPLPDGYLRLRQVVSPPAPDRSPRPPSPPRTSKPSGAI